MQSKSYDGGFPYYFPVIKKNNVYGKKTEGIDLTESEGGK